MTLDKSNPNRYVEDRERKPKAPKPPRGAITKKKNGTYTAHLTVDGIRAKLGTYKERSHAVDAYWEAVKGL